MKKVQLAEYIAVGAHGDQKYGGRPYKYHLQMVVDMVNHLYPESPRLEELVQVAWLHDVLEDTDTVPGDLLDVGFSNAVVTAVTALSKLESDKCNLTEYYNRVATHKLAMKVKIADTLANLTQSTKEGSVKRVIKYSNQLAILHELKALGEKEVK